MRLITGVGSIDKLAEIDKFRSSSNVLFVTGKTSFEVSGAARSLNRIIGKRPISQFNEFEVNPKLPDVIAGAKHAKARGVDLIVGIGGGSVLDMAKLIRATMADPESAKDLLIGKRQLSSSGPPIIQIPTTAGPGSEATHFAVAYVDGQKYSVASNLLYADSVILDGSLVGSTSKYQRACNALDATAQAIESFWSLGASRASDEFAVSALKRLMAITNAFVLGEETDLLNQQVLEAANLSGSAIDISKTTAPHAWSYKLTSVYGIPHGHAVWATLPRVFEVHTRAAAERTRNAPPNMATKMNRLVTLLGLSEKESYADQLQDYLRQLKLPSTWDELGLSHSQRKQVAKSANHERMKNNPIEFTEAEISWIFDL